ncbi:methionine ABC transporter ATP-binding protein [Thalassobacillus pellis]|uniref:methionine ABC transporter ATP-binding protein n=1 Tax=Thalassobacillus pellis TaxID=748008 RepID=UPI0019615DEA|nr:methionine ABC transporter ATP-binding protein [Thalassobacillus pellis]MBM7551991.1 D-methionine transport system ATP-binding protein [Thalassobacillus pellis]
MIEITNLVKKYHSKEKLVTAVDNVSLTVAKGEIFGIVGYSGAGKSSLLRCINLLERPSSGSVKVNGQELTGVPERELRKARVKMGMIFQHFNLISSKTIGENIGFALKAAHYPKKKRKARVNELLQMVGLSDKKDAYPSQLSGGQKQRVGIARSLANEPSVLLCDEATSALDPSTTKSILALLKKINRELGITVILITHEMEVVKEICDRMAIMQDGKIVEQGSVYDIFADPKNELTREFTSSILQFDIPDQALEKVEGTLVKVQFKGTTAGEGVISDMLKQYAVQGNFLHGKIEYIQEIPLGIFVLELKGDPVEIKRAIEYIEERTKQVEVLKGVA